MENGVDIKGLEKLDEIFRITGPKAARRVMRGATADVARNIRNEAKLRVPVRTGTLKRAIKAKSRRGQRGEYRASVYVDQGRKARFDGFYWHMVERGTAHSAAKPFLRPAFDSVKRDINSAFVRNIKKRIIKEIKKVS